MNDSFIYLFFRRMRTPLIVLIAAYAIATVGFTLMPGVDDQGNPWRLSLFEAFYIVSYTGSTIGFGEVPYPFSPAQRLWTMVSIYLTVIAWLFSIGTIVSLIQDPAFRAMMRRARFQRAIRGLNQPYYLVCGYGDTGRALTRALTAQRHPVVVLDTNPDKIDHLVVEAHGVDVAPFRMDARLPENLIQAGLRSRWCLGVFAVTGDDQANLKIAISARLLNQRCIVQARADDHGVAENMRSFHTHQVVNVVDEYVRRLELVLTKPAMFALYQWMNSGPEALRPAPVELPRGPWLVCGHGTLGQALAKRMIELGYEVRVLAESSRDGILPEGAIDGPPTQAETLEAGGVREAAGLLATTEDDADNLSILITARALNPELWIGVVENGLSSQELMRAAHPDLLAQPSVVIAGLMLSRTRSPLVLDFFDQLLEQSDEMAWDLYRRLSDHSPDRPPEFMSLRISDRRSPAVAAHIAAGQAVRLGELLRDGSRWPQALPVEPLLLRRSQQDLLYPDPEIELALGDQLLLAGRPGSASRIESALTSELQLGYLLSGRDELGRWPLHRRHE